jgi:hypothetical protein
MLAAQMAAVHIATMTAGVASPMSTTLRSMTAQNVRSTSWRERMSLRWKR